MLPAGIHYENLHAATRSFPRLRPQPECLAKICPRKALTTKGYSSSFDPALAG